MQQQRCVWRRWRTLAGQLAHEAAQVAAGAVAAVVREQVRTALVALLPGVLEAQSYAQAAAARVLAYTQSPPGARHQPVSQCAAGSHPGASGRLLCRAAPRDARVAEGGAPFAAASAAAAIMAQTRVWSGPPGSGPATTTSSPHNGGLNANATTLAPHASAGVGIPASAPGKWPAHHPARAALAMLWAAERPRHRRSGPETGAEQRRKSPAHHPSATTHQHRHKFTNTR